MERNVRNYAPTLDSTLADTPGLKFDKAAGGMVYIPAGSTITSLTWYAAHEDVAASYLAAYDEYGAAVTQTVAAERCYAIPAALFGAKFVKCLTNADGAVKITLKT